MTTTAALFPSARATLLKRYQKRLEVNPALNRSLVSYQANRKRPFYRWFKYKEGFSAALVDYILGQVGPESGKMLDPFAGTGAAMMVGREWGLDTTGIELMPIGIKVIEARTAAESVGLSGFARHCNDFAKRNWSVTSDRAIPFPHLRITKGAFSPKTEKELNRYRTYLAGESLAPQIRALLELAILNVLETVSFTRKDGQYLRWDHRAPRELGGKPFDKGPIPSFSEAMQRQLDMMRQDLESHDLFENEGRKPGKLSVVQGSCLQKLTAFPDSEFDLVITSPPYCNRYDYTRTYALELAYLGVDEAGLKELRQSLLSCTVENRSKIDELRTFHSAVGSEDLFANALGAFENQEALQETLARLDHMGEKKRLNNPNVPRMVRNYFLESAVVIFELARVVSRGGRVVMVNDNVQYGGEEVPVDLILSDIAEAAGFEIERIWVLEKGKGNSSQQMGQHGRNELRKCVYVWRR